MILAEFLRKQQGKTITQLAIDLDYSYGTIVNLERKVRDPKRISKHFRKRLESYWSRPIEALVAEAEVIDPQGDYNRNNR